MRPRSQLTARLCIQLAEAIAGCRVVTKVAAAFGVAWHTVLVAAAVQWLPASPTTRVLA